MGIKTDLAIENKEIIDEGNQGEKVEIPGVIVKEEEPEEGIKVLRISVESEEGARAMEKPPGNYITIEVSGVVNGADERKTAAARVVARELSRMIPFNNRLRALVVGLGNEGVTPDSLGPHAAAQVRVTRHLFLIYEAESDEEMSCVSVLLPGVMASTGMETAELIQKAVAIVEPHVIIAIDSLAARNLDRISTTIQISDAGISPGAGTGNMRKVLTKETVGAKVVAIGVPTVIDAGTLVLDSLEGFLTQPEAAARHLEGKGERMIVTSSEIDQVIADFSQVIANAINITLHPGIYS